MKTLIIGTVWPEPKSSAAGKRMLQLIESLASAGFEITFACAAAKSANSADLVGIGVAETVIKLNDSGFDQFVGTLQPEVVIFDRYMIEEQFGWRVENAVPDALKVLDTEDLHFLRKARQEAVKSGLLATEAILETETAKREIASILRCDVNLIVSDYEYDLLVSYFKIPSDLLLYLPIWLESRESTASGIAFSKKTNFVSIGNFLHAPNKDAVLELKQKIWPVIREDLPDAELHIYGAYPDQHSMQMHNPKEGFCIHGWVEDAEKVIRESRVLLAPLRFGAGLKGKLLEAMAFGTPFTTTSVGWEGLLRIDNDGQKNASSSLSAPNQSTDSDQDPQKSNIYRPYSFAKSAIALYANEQKWHQARKDGFDTIREKFSTVRWEGVLPEKLRKAKENQAKLRKENFIGQILKHQTMRSTEYFSRWIELKNLRK